MKRLAAAIVVALYLQAPATAATNPIDNPAAKIKNPVDKMYNPATKVDNPAANIYNPATRLDNPNPLSPPTQPVPAPAVTALKPAAKPAEQSPPKPVIPQKSYYFKTVSEYISAAKKAFTKDDYIEFLAITEDALRRIDAKTLKASLKSKQKLVKYKLLGYGLLEKSEE